jgi:phenylacetate-CoA ligase
VRELSAKPALASERPTLVVSAIECADHPVAESCRYQVAWSINPHMTVGSVEFAQAAHQHQAFKGALIGLGAQVIELPFVHGAYDSVFSKDPALLLERRGVRRALLARLRHPERAVEQAARADFLERYGFEVVCESSGPSWEGGDVVMLPSGRAMFLGYGMRSRRGAAEWLERHAEVPVTPLELCDPYLYHLDMALSVLPDGTALVCASALTDEAMAALERAPGIREIIPVPRLDALAFGLNLVSVGNTLVGGVRVPRVEVMIHSRGFRTRPVALEQFQLAGGGAACLVARLHPDPTPRPSARTIAPLELNDPIAVGQKPPSWHDRGSMDIYGPFFRSIMFPIWETYIRQRPVIERWQELKQTQWLSLDELHVRQCSALERLARHAYANVPFYRKRFREAGISGDDLRSPEDLARLPVLRRDELRAHNHERQSTAPPLPTLRKQTSGTTGEPLIFGYEPDSEHWRQAVKLRAYEWAGYRPGDRVLHFWGAPLPSHPPLKTRAKIALDHYMKRETFMQCAVMSESRLSEVVRTIERERPQVIVCYAQAGAELARFIMRNSLRTWQTIPVICGAERVLPRDRADLEEAFGPAVFDTYGCREVMLIAGECEAHHGLHLSMENLIVEILVREGDHMRPAREGESGEVVFTDLHNLGMPFIRYANGDIATAGPSRRCSCGRTLPRIQSIQGRTSETLRDANGAAVSGLALSFLFHDIAGAVRQFQAIQHKDRSVTINLVLSETLSPSKLEEVRRNGARLLTGIDVRVNAVDELPRSPAGKHNLVIVERDESPSALH